MLEGQNGQGIEKKTIKMKHLLFTTIAAVLLVGCGKSLIEW
ncbi:MAG: hypothetical protein QGH62_04550 [Nitrospinaceae bacterium]|jgi:hypothetical protein|nr:hypothetical protein [Nitrospinaceae bacterium]|tara:strand:+ start:204 stop:326 length:123 start_codon:yes stop_codon:yes gene_type:complete